MQLTLKLQILLLLLILALFQSVQSLPNPKNDLIEKFKSCIGLGCKKTKETKQAHVIHHHPLPPQQQSAKQKAKHHDTRRVPPTASDFEDF